MTSRITDAWGYQGDAMNLPVASVDDAVPFYERVMGFRVESRLDEPAASAILVRDGIKMRIVENGGDPTQDGCAFPVVDVGSLHKELQQVSASFPGGSVSPDLKEEKHEDGSVWDVFFVVAPDGLCYWFGEKRELS